MAWVFPGISLGKPMPSLAQMREVLHTHFLEQFSYSDFAVIDRGYSPMYVHFFSVKTLSTLHLSSLKLADTIVGNESNPANNKL